MLLHFSFLLLLTALTGTRSLTTVSGVPVKTGESITIPCLYEPKYSYHVKYLCEGYDWLLCTYRIKARRPLSSLGRFMINDDRSQQVFTVTISDVRTLDTHFWCAVEKKDSDIKQFFELIVTTGVPGLRVDSQDVMGFVGEDLTISFRHSNTEETLWCRLGGPCVRGRSGEIDGTAVIILHHSGFLTVTMKTLRSANRGWYFCSKGAPKMPVHIRVGQRPPTDSRTLTTLSPTSEGVNPTSVSATSEVPTTVQTGEKSYSPSIVFIVVVTVSLVLIVMVTIFVSFVSKKCKKSRPSPATAAEDVTYSEVMFTRNSLGESIRVPAATNTHATYSTLATVK